MTLDVGSTVPRRQLGRYLRQLRERARVTVKDAAERLEVSPQKIWRVETGRGHERIRSLEVEGMCRLYGASGEMTEALVALAKETKARGWWQSYGDAVPAWFELYVGLEAAASHIRQYEQMLIPGLLQTRAYAQAIFRNRLLDEIEVENAVSVRVERQSLLVRSFPAPPQLEVILSEAVLRQPIADRPAMIIQLQALVAASRAPHVSVRVLPLSVGPTRAGVAGAFVILDFYLDEVGVSREPTTVYSESLTGALYLDRSQEIAAYEEVWSVLAGLALDEEESRQMIRAIAGELSCLT